MIEDNEDHALLIRRSIEEGECAVVHYADSAAAIEACEGIRNAEEVPDLILLDLKLPGIDGFGVLERLRKNSFFACVPVVMLTTSARKEEIERAYQLGASGYVVKSEDFGELMAKLKRVKDYWFRTVERIRPAASRVTDQPS